MKVGLVGNIGSGKSTVAEIWKKRGAFVLDADKFAKELMMSNPEIKSRLVETFGEESFHSNGELNRRYLAQEAFEKGRVGELNAIVHPVLFRETNRILNEKSDQYAMVVKEAALLLDYGKPQNLDAVVLVQAPEQVLISRVIHRDHSSTDQVRARLRRQKPAAELEKYADYILKNDSDLATLKQSAEKLYDTLLEKDA